MIGIRIEPTKNKLALAGTIVDKFGGGAPAS
jgi:hypothetical protein